MARTKRTRKQYRGRDAAITPKVIRFEAKKRNWLINWWADNKQDIILRLVQLLVLLILIGIVLLIWNLLT